MLLLTEIKEKRQQRLVDMERRRVDPVLMQQEREFSQLIEVQASVGRMQTKLEQCMAGREEIRERLLDARHIVELLEAEERQSTIGVQVLVAVPRMPALWRQIASLVLKLRLTANTSRVGGRERLEKANGLRDSAGCPRHLAVQLRGIRHCDQKDAAVLAQLPRKDLCG